LPVFVLAFLAIVAVVLLVAAVEFQQLDGAIAEVVGVVGQFRGQGFLEIAAVGLELLKFGAIAGAGQAGEGALTPLDLGRDPDGRWSQLVAGLQGIRGIERGALESRSQRRLYLA
jgi:hypothetical protein